MKDYSEGLDKDFILSYEIAGEDLVIYYSTRIETIKYTKERETEILNKMRTQVVNYADIESKLKSSIISNNAFGSTYCAAAFFNGAIFQSNLNILALIFFLFTLTVSSKCLCDGFDEGSLLNDYRKNKLFLENEDKINEYLRLKSSESIKPVEGQLTSININDVDIMSYSEVKRLIKKFKSNNC